MPRLIRFGNGAVYGGTGRGAAAFPTLLHWHVGGRVPGRRRRPLTGRINLAEEVRLRPATCADKFAHKLRITLCIRCVIVYWSRRRRRGLTTVRAGRMPARLKPGRSSANFRQWSVITRINVRYVEWVHKLQGVINNCTRAYPVRRYYRQLSHQHKIKGTN